MCCAPRDAEARDSSEEEDDFERIEELNHLEVPEQELDYKDRRIIFYQERLNRAYADIVEKKELIRKQQIFIIVAIAGIFFTMLVTGPVLTSPQSDCPACPPMVECPAYEEPSCPSLPQSYNNVSECMNTIRSAVVQQINLFLKSNAFSFISVIIMVNAPVLFLRFCCRRHNKKRGTTENEREESETEAEESEVDNEDIIDEQQLAINDDKVELEESEKKTEDIINNQKVAIEDNRVELEMYQARVAAIKKELDYLEKARNELIQKNIEEIAAEEQTASTEACEEQSFLEKALDQLVLTNNQVQKESPTNNMPPRSYVTSNRLGSPFMKW